MIVTWLYVPGDRPERFAKAAASGADVVIIDLEDAVAPDGKDAARENTLAYLAAREAGGPAVHVRVNDLATPRGRDDVGALAGSGVDGVRVPKVEAPDVLDLLGDLPGYALLESARGVLAASAIAAHPNVAGIALGEQDLAAELSITAESAMDHLRLQVVLAAAAAGLPQVPMSVYPDVRDKAGLLASSARGRSIGLYGRAAIHPRQLPVIREAFRPGEQEIARAREVVALAGQGASALPDGRFVDAPVIARARQVLRLAGEEIEI
ncbi:HpcH/HpaI aldolase/citrate lyase family protein [Nonomuraea soli]|uniref:Citrate lyase subunit beta/citryl-CoA lyase n=1 Tax=Nonomuraea soli TaxID=1032476 RepID=A0A7W0HUW2_9ACTN|nr:CoA ester lyase [Nonomuraea soli]MBA2896377.1 citrate lyase subunit beta/citryl-CoA lyase [Nonomuraea soli]